MQTSLENKPRPGIDIIRAELNRTKQKQNLNRVIRDTVRVLVLVAAIAVLISTLWLPVFQIYGNSMENTLNNGEIVASVKEGTFRRGDIIAFYYNNKILIKRVIAVGGEIVDIKEDGTVYVNGAAIDEPYIIDKSLGDCNIQLPFQVPEDRLFVMGDSREKSVDSRTTTIGTISTEQIIGKVAFRVWPISEFGMIK